MRPISFLKRAGFLFLCAAITALIGSLASTLKVASALQDIGAPIASAEISTMVIYDLQHFAPLYFAFIAIAFTIAFLCAGGVFRIAKIARPLIYTVAGAVAIWVMLFLMQQVFFGVPIVAGARDASGLLLQLLAGGFGGLIFALFTRIKKRAP